MVLFLLAMVVDGRCSRGHGYGVVAIMVVLSRYSLEALGISSLSSSSSSWSSLSSLLALACPFGKNDHIVLVQACIGMSWDVVGIGCLGRGSRGNGM